MAIKYAGSRNLIGYGEAQVYKEADLTKQVRYQEKKAAGKAAAKAKQKADNQKNLTELLKDVDYSNVRDADVSYFKNEFDKILSNANQVTASGVNPLTNIELRKQINQFKANAMNSVNAKDAYNENLKLATTNEDYENEANITALTNENQAPMFGANASFFSTEEDMSVEDKKAEQQRFFDNWKKENNISEGKMTEEQKDAFLEAEQAHFSSGGYINKTTGSRAIMNPNLHVEDWYKTSTENLTPQQITREANGEYKHTAQNGKTVFFTTKEEASEYQLNLAANDILNNHKYGEAFKADQEQAAAEAGYFNDDDEVDVMEYVKDQIRARTTKIGGDKVTDLPKSSMNISMSSGQQAAPASGEEMPTDTYEYEGVNRVVDGVPRAMEMPLAYSTVTVPAVYKDVPNPNDPTKTIQELVTPELKGRTFDFGMKPLDIRPGEAGFMVFGNNADIENAGMVFGHNTGGQNIKFTPNSIVFKQTANKAITVKTSYGTVKIKKGEALDDDLVRILKQQNKTNLFEPKPWLEGKEADSGITVSIGFNDSVHARFSTFVNTQSGSASVRKQNRKVYEDMMKGIGVEPRGTEASAR